ncbi:MAG: hypothetical protein IAE94_14040 [Chthoniobacterales bacterium]|nr:hypothetical protein [Chthoniobacterales bacterium]
MSNRRVLVLTREHPPWNADDDVIFLGPWCLARPHEGIPKDLPSAKSFSLLPFHWNDRGKLRDDYEFLDGLHARLLTSLAEDLNHFHGTPHSRRYWQILLDPWLMAYVGVMFDRWEAIRLALADGGTFAVAAGRNRVPRRDFSFNDFTEKILSDSGNGQIWEEMLRTVHPGRVTFFEVGGAGAAPSERPPQPHRKTASLKRAARRIATWFGPLLDCLSARSRFVFHQTMFDPLSLTRLSLALGQLPVFFHHALQFEAPSCPPDAIRPPALSFAPGNAFEAYLVGRLPGDLPGCVVEHFPGLKSRAKNLCLSPKVILTAQSHWMNPLVKAWMADRTETGAELIILEHGGSFPALREFFDFEEDIADRKGTWFLPCHAKQVQVPPAKLLRQQKVAPRNRQGRRETCLIVGGDCPRYVYRAVFYPMADQGLRSFEMVNTLISRLRPDIRKATRIRPYQYEAGWNTGDLYAERHGVGMITTTGTLTQAFVTARVIVCTYPETTFTEAMSSGKPTILIYDPCLNERHPATFALIEKLRRARVIFFEAAEAAAHLNTIWGDPQKWWENDPEVVAARRDFESQACRITGDWLGTWKKFLLKPVVQTTAL